MEIKNYISEIVFEYIVKLKRFLLFRGTEMGLSNLDKTGLKITKKDIEDILRKGVILAGIKQESLNFTVFIIFNYETEKLSIISSSEKKIYLPHASMSIYEIQSYQKYAGEEIEINYLSEITEMEKDEYEKHDENDFGLHLIYRKARIIL